MPRQTSWIQKMYCYHHFDQGHIDGLVQERRNPIANALELRLFCTNPSICSNGSYRLVK